MRFLILFAFFFLSCGEEPIPTFSEFLVQAGDIVVTNTASDSLLLLDKDGNFKKVLYDVENTAEVIYGVAWMHTTKEVIASIDGADRVIAISAYDGSVRTLMSDANLAGTIRGLTQLTDGDILVIESNNLERFTSDSTRITSGWPITNIQSTPHQIDALPNGGFVLCSYGTDVVRTYDANGTQTATVSSSVGGTTNAYGCMGLKDGRVAGVWNGTTDSVIIYSSDLSSEDVIYSDIVLLGNPRGIAQRANGNLLIADATYHHIVEITLDGTFVRVIGGTVLNLPTLLIVVPEYY